MKSLRFRILLLLLLACSPAFLPLIKAFLPPYKTVSTAYELFFLTPFLLFGLVAFLGLRLNQTRILYSTILFIILFISVHRLAFNSLEPINFDYFQKVLLVFSLANFLFIFILDEGAILGLFSFLRVTSIIVTILFSYMIAGSENRLLQTIFSGSWITSGELWILPDILWPVLISTAVFLLIRKEKAIYSFIIALVLSFITLLMAFNKNIAVQEFTLELKIYNAFAFTIIGLICLYSVYKLYWQNVYIDELTSIPNRRAFNEQLKKLGRKYSIAMLDIDHFKNFNDTYGHSEGDNVLRYVASHLDIFSKSKVFRYGGEEFSIVYPGRKTKEVHWHLEHMREELDKSRFFIRMSETKRSRKSEKDRGKTSPDGKKVKVTLSIGLAQRSENLRTPEDVIEAADKALYLAKKKGRNQIVVSRK
jgi:diguanylate cyclase (GGDEF)-like protein